MALVAPHSLVAGRGRHRFTADSSSSSASHWLLHTDAATRSLDRFSKDSSKECISSAVDELDGGFVTP